MTNRIPQDGLQPDDIERLLMPNPHDFPEDPNIIKFSAIQELHVIADCKDHECLIERGAESVMIKASEINALVAKLLKAKDLFG